MGLFQHTASRPMGPRIQAHHAATRGDSGHHGIVCTAGCYRGDCSISGKVCESTFSTVDCQIRAIAARRGQLCDVQL